MPTIENLNAVKLSIPSFTFRKTPEKVLMEAWNKAKSMTWKECQADDLFLALSEGNKKYRKSALVRFLIVNLVACHTCPFRTPHCQGSCYARKAESAYPTVLPYRLKMVSETALDTFVEKMIFTISAYYHRGCYQKAKKIVIRIHESGDFYNRNYARKWLEIMDFLRKVGADKIIALAYTKSLPFFRNIDQTKHPNLFIVASVWDDTEAKLRAESFSDYRVYTVANDEKHLAEILAEAELQVGSEAVHFCECSDCGTCEACWNRKYKIIIVLKH